ncbi:MAG: hypothetical protein JNM80_14300 [Phycisphaerae bacterium]|nr:hypothetical protein [Phycisphaerae bacterium]
MSEADPSPASNEPSSAVAGPRAEPSRRTVGLACDQCGYLLWGMRDRRCPECGRGFLPSDYDFVPGAVAFACPHCDQAYFGTGRYGRLEPFVFSCVRCGERLSMDDTIVTPAPGVDPMRTVAAGLPWLDRARLGRFTAWRKTLVLALFDPARLARAMPDPAGGCGGVRFGVLTILMYLAVMFLPFVALVAFSVARAGGLGGWGGGGIFLASSFLLTALFLLLLVPLWGLLAHLVLICTGRRAGGLSRTLGAMGFASGCAVLGAVPCLGVYLLPIAAIWPAISGIIILRHAQRVGWWRSVFAVGLGPVLVAVGATLLFALPAYLGARISLGTARAQAAQARAAALAAAQTLPPSAMPSTHGVTAGLRTFQLDHGRWPAHALEAIEANAFPATTLCMPDAAIPRVLADVPAGGTGLDRFVFLERPDARLAISRAVANLPPGVVAHRLGDFVFTYHGVNHNGDGRLWIVVARGEVGADPANGVVGRGLVAGQLDGTIHPVTEANVPAALAEQNEIRAEHGMPPLPDPAIVTHERPK